MIRFEIMKGVIESINSKNTAIVKVERVLRHPRLLKIVTRHKKFHCYVPDGVKVNIGQWAEIKETSPADNTGAKSLVCIGIPERSNLLTATLGDVINAVVKGADPVGLVKDHEIVRAVIIRVRKEVRRRDGSYIRFDDNAAVVVNTNNEPVGTRVFGPVARELRDKGFSKIVSFAPEVW